MKLKLILWLFLAFSGTAPIYTQISESEKLFAEANESRFNDPYKSLKLYDYLLKNSNTEEAVDIELKKIQINRLLGQYQEAVAISQKIQNSVSQHSNFALQFEYWRELAMLYRDLDLKREEQSLYKKAQQSYKELSPGLRNKYAVDLELLKITHFEDRQVDDKIKGLKLVLKKLDEEDERSPFIQYHIAKLYYPLQQDSSKLYFKKLLLEHRFTPLYEASKVYLDLIESIEISDSITLHPAARNLFDHELQPLLLNNAINQWEENKNLDSVVVYQNKLRKLTMETHLEQRQAKVALIQGFYRQKQLDAASEVVKKNRQRGFILGFFGILILVYFGYKLYVRNKKTKVLEEDTSKSIVISDKTEEEILEKLKKFENSKLFLDKQMRIASLAKQLDTNTRYLSSIINASKDKSFNAYINSLRIQFIVDKLNTDSEYRRYKISYLANKSGFASQSSFTTAFKEVTGQTPSAYIRRITT